MQTLLRILLGLGIAAIGVYTVLHTEVMQDLFGPVDWAERKFGGGGTRLFYKLVGVGVALLGFVVMTGLWHSLLQSTLGSVIPSARQTPVQQE